MAVSLYPFSAPVLARNLENLKALLKKGEAFAEAKKVDPAVFTAFRLAPDMLPLTSQIYICTDQSKGCMARLAGVEIPKYEDTEKTFSELCARLDKTVAFIRSIKPEQLEGADNKPIVIKTPRGDLNFTGLTYLQGFVLPNVFFHSTTAYNILRHNGVEVGKLDYLAGSGPFA